jgi:predicted PurR-regulated permease PerM
VETQKSGKSVPDQIQAAKPHDEVEIVHASITFRTAVRLALGLFIAYFAVQFARSIPETATRVLLGLVFAFAFDPIVTRLQRRLNTTRGIAVTVVGVLTLALFSVLVAIAGPSAVREAANSSRDLPETVDKLTELPLLGSVLDRLDAPERIREWVADAPSQLSDQSISDFVEAVIGGMATGGTVIVVGVAVLLDGEALVRRLRQLVPQARRQQADLVGRLFQRTIGAYFAGSLLVASLAATFVLIVGLSLNVPLTPIAALWVLIVGFIPQIGGFLAASVFTVLALGRGPGTALLCLVLYWAYMTFENHVIQPAIVGNAVNLSAPATMLAALIGGSAMGVPGAILATPVAATVKALYLELREPGSTEQAKRPSVLSKLWHRVKKD